MRCPHCGIHYMDDERECPICGKRPGILTPREKQVSDTQEVEKRKPTQAAWQRTAARQQNKKQSSFSIGCLTIIIIIVIINIAVGIARVFMEMASNSSADFTAPEPEYNDSAEISCGLLNIFPTGTWVNTDHTITMAVDNSGTISWTDGIHTAVDDNPLCSQLILTEDNANEYCSEQELELYPITEYTRYTLYAWDYDTDLQLNICIYIPKESSLPDIAEFHYYDCISETFQAFTYVSDATELPIDTMV